MPQQRNTANRIFGGFLMHRAFEVAFCAAYTFGGSRPQFLEIDEVVFLQPVDVGDIVRFDACVLYTRERDGAHPPAACVEVLASVVRPEAVMSKVSNRFNMTFRFPELSGDLRLREVVPADATEAARVLAAKERDMMQELDDKMDVPS
ncbi:unnamed protein product [Discosporangium mesarthrocarpum]